MSDETQSWGQEVLAWRQLPYFLATAVVVTIFLCALVYLLPRHRSFVVTAEAKGLTVTIDSPALSIWPLAEATLCINGTGERHEVPDCGWGKYTRESVRNGELRWPVGATLRVERTSGEADMSIWVTAVEKELPSVGETTLPVATRIIIPNRVWVTGPALSFSGTVIIGDLPTAGAAGIVESGAYEIREAPPFQSRPYAVTSGKFFPGDRIEFHDEKGKALSGYGFIAPTGDAKSGFTLTSYTPPSNGSIFVRRLATEPIHIWPSWVDRALSDPILAALAAVLGLIATGFGLTNTWVNLAKSWPRQAETHPKPSAGTKASGTKGRK